LYLKMQTDGLLHESNTHAQKNTWYFNNNNKISHVKSLVACAAMPALNLAVI